MDNNNNNANAAMKAAIDLFVIDGNVDGLHYTMAAIHGGTRNAMFAEMVTYVIATGGDAESFVNAWTSYAPNTSRTVRATIDDDMAANIRETIVAAIADAAMVYAGTDEVTFDYVTRVVNAATDAAIGTKVSGRTVHDVDMVDMFDRHDMGDSVTIAHNFRDGSSAVATFDSDGTVTYLGESYDSLSSAATAAGAASSANGWAWWSYEGRPMTYYRDN